FPYTTLFRSAHPQEEGVPGDPCVVDEDVDRAHLVFYLAEQLRHALSVRDFEAKTESPGTAGRDLAGHLRRPGRVAARDDDGGSFPGQALRHGLAQAARGPRHQGDFPLQLHGAKPTSGRTSSRVSGDSTLKSLADRSIRRMSPERTRPGPISTNPSIPAAHMWRTDSSHRTGALTWRARARRISSGRVTGAAVTLL